MASNCRDSRRMPRRKTPSDSKLERKVPDRVSCNWTKAIKGMAGSERLGESDGDIERLSKGRNRTSGRMSQRRRPVESKIRDLKPICSQSHSMSEM